MTTLAVAKGSARNLQLWARLLASELGVAPPIGLTTPHDPRVMTWIQAFQRQHGLPVTGELDKATKGLLRQRAAERAGARALPGHNLPVLLGLQEDERFYFYLRYLAAIGGDAREAWSELVAGRRVLLGLRVPTNTRSRQGAGAYDDRVVVLWFEAGGHCAEFEANTDPSSRYEDQYEHAHQKKATTKDANADGRGDLGRLPYGIYRFKKEVSERYGDILRPTRAIMADRDTAHDGWFDAGDKVSKRAALNSGTSILFHRGGTRSTGSAGCQTLRPSIFGRFFSALGSQTEFVYLLVPAKEAWSKPVPRITHLPDDAP